MDSIILKSFIPEIFISLSLLLQLFLNAFIINKTEKNFPIINKEIFIQISFIFICLIFLLFNNKIEGYFYNFLLLNDFSTKIVKILLLIIIFFALFPIARSFENQCLNFFEFYIVFLFSVLSSLLLFSVSDLLSLYLILELQALSFYILASFKRNSSFSAEAGLKYFISGSFISGIFLMGCSIIYIFLGTLNFNSLSLLLAFSFEDLYFYNALAIAIFFIIFVFLFKLTAVPFHFWSPDVYEGAPLSSTIIFTLLPKLSIFYIFSKWLLIVSSFHEVKYLLIISGLLSIFIGAFFALRQKRLKRLIIYSSISQLGFLISALSSITLNSLISIYFFLFIYLITSLLIWNNFALLISFQNNINKFYNKIQAPLFISSVSNFFNINKIWGLSNLLIFFSLAGIPPLVGFFSKFLVIFALVDEKNILSSFLLLMISAISVYYYLRIIKIIFFENKNNFNIDNSQIVFNDKFFFGDCLVISFLLFLLVFLFFFPSFILLFSNLIVNNYFF
jgi:NADH-quinone oxidoreductase subunit N